MDRYKLCAFNKWTWTWELVERVLGESLARRYFLDTGWVLLAREGRSLFVNFNERNSISESESKSKLKLNRLALAVASVSGNYYYSII